jgi:hypothetical protein
MIKLIFERERSSSGARGAIPETVMLTGQSIFDRTPKLRVRFSTVNAQTFWHNQIAGMLVSNSKSRLKPLPRECRGADTDT